MRAIMKKYLQLLLPAIVLCSCTAHHMATADKAYDRLAYKKAACSYEKVMQNSNDRETALKLADSYRRQNKWHEAANWYAFAERISPLDAQRSKHYGQVLMSLQRTDEAMAYLDRSGPDDPVIAQMLAAGRERASYFKDSSLYSVRPLTLEGISGAFSATFHQNGIVFAGERPPGTSMANPWNGMSFLDLYHTSRTPAGAWSRPTELKGGVNGRFHEGPVVFSADGRTMYFTRSDYYKFRLNKDGSSISHLKLFRAELNDGEWGNIHQFAHNGEDFSTGHAALSNDGNTLYFISDRPGGLGGTDLYFCTRTSEGWSDPINLGGVLNTSANEMFPTVHGDTLLFSSTGHGGLGGLDVFRTWRENGEWVKPQNMNYPLNSSFDDFALVWEKDGRSGFISSDRTGHDMIHSITQNDPVLTLKGRCIDYNTSVPIPQVLVKVMNKATRESRIVTTDLAGEFIMDLLPGQELELQTTKDGWLNETVDLSTIGQRTSKTYDMDVALIPIEMDRPIVVNNIYYDYDKWDIRSDAAIELMKLARLFNDNPEYHFELSSHTDSRASDTYNLLLSEARAKSAVDFLVRQGVDPTRLKAKGHGESRLVNHCKDNVQCSEELHQQNRRTEFRIMRPEVVTTP